MKKIILFLAFLFSTLSFYAQENTKNDVVLKLNGDELTGKVLKMGDESIDFSYAGETLVYTIKLSDIMKITFASGRIQVINKPPLPSESQNTSSNNNTSTTPAPSLEAHHNKVAILPFNVVRDGQPSADVIGDKIQSECYSMLIKHSGVYTIMDTRTSNALLAKAGVTKDNIKTFTMSELCNILGVEYAVDCLVSINRTTQVQSSSSSGSTSNKYDNKSGNNNKNYNNYSSSTTNQNYRTSLNLSVYNDKDVNVYSQERTSFWTFDDAYKSTLEYLLKRTPIYSK